MAVKEFFLVCRPSADGVPVDPCGTIGGSAYYPQVIESHVITAELVAQIEMAAQPFDYQEAAAFFMAPIFGLIGLYLAAFAVGSIVKTVGDA